MKLGVLVHIGKDDIEQAISKVHDMGFESCQLCCWDHTLCTDENAEIVNEATKKYGVEISTFWCGWSGPQQWNFYDGPLTLGLVPEDYRNQRMQELLLGSDFAQKIGVTNVATHVGFIPETPNTREYHSLICSLRYIATSLKSKGQYFLFETGQETPVTLRRAIEDIGTDNLGINLDPANLILYGKANPIDALEVFGSYVRDIHGKDGCYPTNGRELGLETPIGEGKVNFPAFVAKLKEIGYDGPITIEREISGEQQIKDIKAAKVYLEKLI
ncbi:MAG: sugar phosphate isomerase/epimerase [Clostridia bacterium]|nr:sugar phosphate isomerase/epimerase [Clostridia bacterium]